MQKENLFVNDLNLNNIAMGYNNNCVLIDYDSDLITKKIGKSYMYEKYLIEDVINKNYDKHNAENSKYYGILLAQISYFLFLKTMNTPFFHHNFLYNYKYGKYTSLNIANCDEKYKEILKYNIYDNFEKLFYDPKTERGLFSIYPHKIPSLDEVLYLTDNIKIKDIPEYILPSKPHNFMNNIMMASKNKDRFEMSKYGLQLKNYLNPNIYKFKFWPESMDKSQHKFILMKRYLLYNDWDIVPAL